MKKDSRSWNLHTTLEERRHRAHMVQTFKILQGIGRKKSDTWFAMAGDSDRLTRSAADPLNIKLLPARLDLGRNFFSHRVISDWNKVPADIKR